MKNQITYIVRRVSLWWTHRQIRQLEAQEAQARASLIHLQTKILPVYRARRNKLLFGGAE